MEKRISPWVSVAFLAFILLFSGVQAALANNDTCLECHEDVVVAKDFMVSVHGQNGIECSDCHAIDNLTAHVDAGVLPATVDCTSCHGDIAAQHDNSVHKLNEVSCIDCHNDIHTMTVDDNKQSIVDNCSNCHEMEDYAGSSHGMAVADGNEDAATCADCHGLHEIKSLSSIDEKEARQFRSAVCIKCHGDEEMMKRNGVLASAVHTYLDSYHGKSFQLGYAELTATCTDCHGGHGILPQNDPASMVNVDNRAMTCGKCHEGATRLFGQFYAHGDHSDFTNYPVLAITFWAMTTLLVCTFSVFWLHSILWMIRGIADNREKKAALAAGKAHIEIPDGHRVYKRFQNYHIFMHLLVIISFLILALTGLPLKFYNQHWAQVLIDFYGGTANAAYGHRIGACITFVYFGMALVLSVNFLFIRKDIPGMWLQRLFGPDSLMPNLRDIQDVTNMVRWFLWKGPKPTFERWNYWEKFDFIAVFWGMFAIGGSGLMLWFPELFGLFLPGWVFNVATIVHSDEALLATGFIFSVHFFNTHVRPEKFPMDFVIFNGEMDKEEFIEERGDQWKRYEEMGITEKFFKEKTSSPVYGIMLKTFGFIAVAIGVTLFILMVLSVLGGH
ncbi:MAG: cytochrome C [Desulfobacteraceae bacterium 4572_35.1]|nr:MAG: cytochrome C [Desulfobacteraceae bacterium 4572_35.1]